MVVVEGIRAEGCGNAYLFVDAARVGESGVRAIRERAATEITAWLARLGGSRLDGLILLEADPESVWRLRVWNADGSRGEVCGNGLRAAALLASRVHGRDRGTLASDNDRHEFDVERTAAPARVSVSLSPPNFEPTRIPFDASAASAIHGAGDEPLRVHLNLGGREVVGYALSLGNPHLIVPSREPVIGPLVDGAALEHHAAFPARVNVSWIWRTNESRIGQRTHERGSGETAACGSGACAGAVVASHLGWTGPKVDVEQPGGVLTVERGVAALTLSGPASIGSIERLEL